MMHAALQSFWTEPRPPDAPARVDRDWILVVLLVPTAIIEYFIRRQDLLWGEAALVFSLCAIVGLLYRRTHGSIIATALLLTTIPVELASIGPDQRWGLFTTACILFYPYAVFRWGSGREAARLVPVLVLVALLSIVLPDAGFGDAFFALVIFLCLALLGAVIRYRANARDRMTNEIKFRERSQLARELHDTVAHHMSAIAIQAQAGQFLATSGNIEAAQKSLAVIEEEASRALNEMRSMVGALRDETADDAAPAMAPQHGIADIAELAISDPVTGPAVSVDLIGDLDHLRPSVEAAVYRLAQESITNAVRHARAATQVNVTVIGETDAVRLHVADNGASATLPTASTGFGLVGMQERAQLLGGDLRAGPDDTGGWSVSAFVPRSGRVDVGQPA